jgi:hypothetical protein
VWEELLHRPPRAPAPFDIRTWAESIDDKHFAAIAFAETPGAGGRWRAVSYFLILDKTPGWQWQSRWRDALIAHFGQMLWKEHGGRPPVVKDDVNWRRWGAPEDR